MATQSISPASVTPLGPASPWPRTVSAANATSRLRHLAGGVLTAIPVLFLVFDVFIKLANLDPVIESMIRLGYRADAGPGIGALELVCLALYLLPGTAPAGAVLLTGYLGGAVATHVRVGDPLFTHVLFPVYVAALLWAGLYLRDARVRRLLGKHADAKH